MPQLSLESATLFTGEAYYTFPGLYPGDSLKLLYGIGLENGVVNKEFYPADMHEGGAGYRCCRQVSRIETSKIEVDGVLHLVREVVIVWDCSGCGGPIVVYGPSGGGTGSGTGSPPGNWSPGNIGNNGNGNGNGSGSNGGNTRDDPKFYGPLCPDGSPRPPGGCKCPDGTPMPQSGDCDEDECQLTNIDLVRTGASVLFNYTPLPIPFICETNLVGRLTNCKIGSANYKTIITAYPSGYSTRVIDEYAAITDNTHYKYSKRWWQKVNHFVQIELKFALVIEFTSTESAVLNDISFPFTYK